MIYNSKIKLSFNSTPYISYPAREENSSTHCTTLQNNLSISNRCIQNSPIPNRLEPKDCGHDQIGFWVVILDRTYSAECDFNIE